MTTYYDFQESADEAAANAQMEAGQAQLSDELYCLAMQMTDMGLKDVDTFIRRQCDLGGISYPPKQQGVSA